MYFCECINNDLINRSKLNILCMNINSLNKWTEYKTSNKKYNGIEIILTRYDSPLIMKIQTESDLIQFLDQK